MGFGVAAFTRFASEAWWARQDSNLQPDRYERPALTIELQAPPRTAAHSAAGNGACIVYSGADDPAMPGLIHRNAGEFHHFAPLLGLVGDQFAEFGRRHRLWNTADVGEPRHQFGVLQRLADRLVEDVDDLGWRALSRRDAVEADR